VALWADHRVTACDAASYDLHHPVVGAVTVTQQTLAIARSPEQNLIVVTTAAGSPSEEALTQLHQAGIPAGSARATRIGRRHPSAGSASPSGGRERAGPGR
jgi:hypothetical protein